MNYVENYVIDKLLGNKNKSVNKILDALIDVLLQDHIKKLRSGMCPFCLKMFKKRGIKTHLRNNEVCSKSLTLTVRYVVDVYNLIRKSKTYRTNREFEITLFPNVVFRNSQQLSKYIREHPEVLNNILYEVVV